MAEWQSSIGLNYDQGDDQWGIRPSTSRKGYLLVSLPEQQDIRFMPRFSLFQIHWILQILFILYITEGSRKCIRDIYMDIYIGTK